MTSFAFIMGVIPLVAASGAGKEMRHAMGLAVFAGMLGVTLFGLFLTPVFFVTVETLFGGRREASAKGDAEMPAFVELAPAAGAREDVPALFATEQSARKRSAKLP
jgi:multidrug efflux pump